MEQMRFAELASSVTRRAWNSVVPSAILICGCRSTAIPPTLADRFRPLHLRIFRSNNIALRCKSPPNGRKMHSDWLFGASVTRRNYWKCSGTGVQEFSNSDSHAMLWLDRVTVIDDVITWKYFGRAAFSPARRSIQAPGQLISRSAAREYFIR